MCGLAGFLWRGRAIAQPEEVVRAMGAALTHRGPDDDGLWLDDVAGVALAFRRLAILDLSPAGAQPMVSADGRYVLVFNGEIYNAGDLRAQLAPHPWRGHSDTEVLLEACARWGASGALRAAEGMFALALWDRHKRCLTLARDRLGEKPLYYGRFGECLAFASELKALRRHPAFDPTVDRDALAAYVRHGWLPHPRTIHAAVRQLPPAHFLVIDAQGRERLEPYWSARIAASVPAAAASQSLDEELERRLSSAVARCLRADVPVGLFLSGGVDSSAIAALASEHGGIEQAFTLSFAGTNVDETDHARTLAGRIGIRHTIVPVDGAQARDLVASLPAVYDEPFADLAALPLLLLSRAAGRQVRVVLSGDGADELFGGYGIYGSVLRQWRRTRWLPGRRLLAGLAHRLPVAMLDACGTRLGRAHDRRSYPGRRLKTALDRLAAPTPAALLDQFRTLWRGVPPTVLGTTPGPFDPPHSLPPEAGRQIMLRDLLGYLPDDLCVKTDRATMAHGLEARMPFLDRQLVEFSWRLPDPLTGGPGPVKAALRRVLNRRGLGDIVNRPKQGLEVPAGAWLRNELRDWAEDLLDPVRLRDDGFFRPADIMGCWGDHLNGRRDWSNELWTVLMFQAWLHAEQPVPASPVH